MEQVFAHEKPEAKRRYTRLMGVALSALLIALIANYVSFVWQVNAVQTESRAAGNADGVVVLTGDANRISQGVALLHSNQGRRLLISGVDQKTSRKALARSIGEPGLVFGCCVDIDRDALDTKGNALSTEQWVKRNGFKSLLVVTSDYHMPRALHLMKQRMPEIELLPVSIRSGRVDNASLLTRALSPVVVREYLKFVAMRFGIEPSAKLVLSALDGGTKA